MQQTLLYQMYSRVCCIPHTPPGGNVHTLKRLFEPTQMFVKFQLSGSNSFLDMRGSQMYSGGAAALTRPLAQINSHPTRVFGST